MSIYFGLSRVMTVKTANFRGDIYKNDKNAELRCGPAPIGLENWTMIIIFSYCFKKLTHPSNLRCSAFLLLLLCFCYCAQRKLDKPCEKTDRKEIHILLLFAPFQKLWFTLTKFQIHEKKSHLVTMRAKRVSTFPFKVFHTKNH